jgi:hypothetical protein
MYVKAYVYVLKLLYGFYELLNVFLFGFAWFK